MLDVDCSLGNHWVRHTDDSGSMIGLEAIRDCAGGLMALILQCTLDCRPDLLRRERHIEMRNTEWH